MKLTSNDKIHSEISRKIIGWIQNDCRFRELTYLNYSYKIELSKIDTLVGIINTKLYQNQLLSFPVIIR